MSTSSTATALGRDQVPSNNPHLKAKICMFIITRKDGALFDVTSVTEEDVMEICVTLGHTHFLGVLWYSVMESVALFHMTEEMQWASCSAVKAMELWDELIAVWVMAPLEHRIEAYMAIVGGNHSKLQSMPSGVEGDPHSLTGNPHLGANTASPPGRAWQPCRPGAVVTCGRSPSGDYTVWAACTPQQSSTNSLGRTFKEQ